ncbi:hypothetical protein [Leptospira weilii]|uniref:hypothetical protein n=1 Tax=Leptospira weilii TaxID=28184 RepID=UPI000382F26C|nr:hypothetical protein [Leptospira weilii]
MSIENLLRTSFEKNTNARLTIIKLTSYNNAELNIMRKPIWTVLKTVPGYFFVESQTETRGEGGERQAYDATAEVIFDELKSIENSLDQKCRILDQAIPDGVVSEDVAEQAWLIEKFIPINRKGDFWIVSFGLNQSEKGNRVHLK